MTESKLQSMLKKALNGDRQALEYCDVNTTDVIDNKYKVIIFNSLANNYHFYVQLLIAAKKLGLETLRITTRSMIRHLSWIARHHFKSSFDEETRVVEQHEILETMLMLSHQLPKTSLSDLYHHHHDCGGLP